MRFVPALLAVVGLIVAIAYAAEAFLVFRATGVSSLFFIKAIICGIGCYIFWLNFRKARAPISNEVLGDSN